jgi:hypothetical protein
MPNYRYNLKLYDNDDNDVGGGTIKFAYLNPGQPLTLSFTDLSAYTIGYNSSTYSCVFTWSNTTSQGGMTFAPNRDGLPVMQRISLAMQQPAKLTVLGGIGGADCHLELLFLLQYDNNNQLTTSILNWTFYVGTPNPGNPSEIGKLVVDGPFLY